MPAYDNKELAKSAGSKGGKAKVPTKGFGANAERARLAGLKGLEAARKNREQAQLNPRIVHIEVRDSTN